MFKKPTAFVLGAGASWHYGYPTGEDLVNKVIEKAALAAEFFRETGASNFDKLLVIRPDFFERYASAGGGLGGMQEQWTAAYRECEELAKRLREVRPLVIDYFLGQNDSLKDIGKLIIAWVILECEAHNTRTRTNLNRQDSTPHPKDNWYRFLLHKLVNGCAEPKALLSNKVTFVTFNYDVSLEWHIARGLRHIEMFRDHVDDFFKTHRVLHVYGRVRDYPGSEFKSLPVDGRLPINVAAVRYEADATVRRYHVMKDVFNMAYEASKKIRTIDPHDKGADVEVLGRAQGAIRGAECVYILGYGFDELNSARLLMDSSLRLGGEPKKVVAFTNFGDSNRINKAASQLFFANTQVLLPPAHPIKQSGTWYCEKSTRDVYEAFENDFDPIEERNVFG